MTGLRALRSQPAKCLSRGVTPARASTRRRTISASLTARVVWSRMRPVRLSASLSSRPAVSITVKRRSPIRAAPRRRSRVTPGWSLTIARRLPTSRLNRVDLPTFGRPTTATVKDMGWTKSAVRGQIAVVGQDVHRVVRHDRRLMRLAGQRHAPERFPGVGGERDGVAIGSGDHQPVAQQNRPGPNDRVLAILFVLELRQRLDPADAALVARNADEFAVGAQHIDEVADGPGRLRAADADVPQAAPALQIDGRHRTAV